MKWNKKHIRKLWFVMAIIFVLGVFFSMEYNSPVLMVPVERQNSIQTDAKVMAIEDEYRVGDFCTNSSSYRSRNGGETFRSHREAMVWILCVVCLYTYLCVIRYRWYFTEKFISVVHLIYYIHRSDGKKRACFAAL